MWILLALTCAFFTGTSDALAKGLLSRCEERVVAWGKLLFTLPWVAFVPLLGDWPRLGWPFVAVLGLLVPVELSAYFCYLKAVRISPLSLVVPFLAFSPLFLVVTGWVILGERVSAFGFLGILAVTAGAYVLQLEHRRQGYLEPFHAMYKVPGIRFMLFAAALYAAAAALSKRAIEMCGPTTFPILYLTLDTLVLTGLARQGAATYGGLRKAVTPHLRLFILSGLATAAAFITHCLGVLLVPVAYFIALKRLSLLVGVLYGGLLFRETAFGQRLLGASLMVSGAIIIILMA